jgi:hypothetical protein
MKLVHRPIAVAALIAAGLVPAVAALPGPVSAAAARSAAPPGGTRLWAARFSAGTDRTATATAVATSPDGATVYVTGLTSLPDPTPMNTYDTVAYNAATGARLWTARFRGMNGHHPNDFPAIAVSPDGSKVIVFGHFREPGEVGRYLVLAYNAATGKQLWVSLPGGGISPAHAVVVSPDSKTVFVTGVNSHAYDTIAVSAGTGAKLWESFFQPIEFARPTVRALAVSPGGSAVFVAGSLGTIAYKAGTGAQLWVQRYKQRWGRNPAQMAVSPDGSTVFVTGSSSLPTSSPIHFLTIAYNAATGAQVWAASNKSTATSGATSLALSPDGSTVYATGLSAPATAQAQYLTIAYHAATGAAVWVRRIANPGIGFLSPAFAAAAPGGTAVYVAGSGNEANGQSGYLATAYDPATGKRLWVAHYQGPGGTNSVAQGVAVNASQVFVTGFSARASSTLNDYATIALEG